MHLSLHLVTAYFKGMNYHHDDDDFENRETRSLKTKLYLSCENYLVISLIITAHYYTLLERNENRNMHRKSNNFHTINILSSYAFWFWSRRGAAIRQTVDHQVFWLYMELFLDRW